MTDKEDNISGSLKINSVSGYGFKQYTTYTVREFELPGCCLCVYGTAGNAA